MTHVAFAIPGNINAYTGGYAYDRHVMALLPGHHITVDHVALPDSYPTPAAADLDATRRQLAATDPTTVLLIDGLAYGAMPAELIRSLQRPIVALVHHPLCLETGLSADQRIALQTLEVDALKLADRVIASSPTTARLLSADFAVPSARIRVAEPGTEAAERARGSGSKTLNLLAVGAIVPRKGYDVLINALAPLRALDWRLDIIGDLSRSPETAAALTRQIAERGLSARVRLVGAVDPSALQTFYDRADLFVLASHFEGYGMVLSEAVAHGLPIVCTTAGAADQTAPEGAALKAELGDWRTLMWALGRAIDDRSIRGRLADASWAAAAHLPRWADTARTVAETLAEVER